MRIKLFTILALFCLTVSSAWADGEWTSGGCDVKLIGHTLTVSKSESGNGAMANYSFENEGPWFSVRSSITSVIIESGVTSIGDHAFHLCIYMETVAIPASVTSIGNGAFSQCYDLTSIIIPANVKSIGVDAFYNCRKLMTVTIPASVTSIGSFAFASCDNLMMVTFAEGSQLTSILEHTFMGCENLATVNIPASVTSIGIGAFSGTGLTSITIPASVTSIGLDAFNRCSSLVTMTVDGENSVYDSRNGCNAIIETKTNTLIQGCNGSTIPDGVTRIDGLAFEQTSLISINIPASVTSIDGRAFSGCNSLVTMTVDDENSVYDSRNGCNAIIETETNTLIQGFNSSTIPDGVTSIGPDAFEQISLKSITIPASVTSIGPYAFVQTSLTSITIPASVTSIGVGAFNKCGNLKTVTVYPPSCTLGKNAFQNCSKLTNIYVFSDKESDYKSAENWSSYADIITAIPDLTATEGATGEYWATYYNGLANIQVPSGTQVFKVKLTGTELVLTEIEDRVINMGEGIVLKSNTANIMLLSSVSGSIKDDYSDNSLEGTMTDITIPDYDKVYVLSKDTNGMGFYKLSSGATFGANMAYLKYDGGTDAPEFFLFDEATGIKEIGQFENLQMDNLVYDLQGRRVAQPTKGMYIVNGKKVFINKNEFSSEK